MTLSNRVRLMVIAAIATLSCTAVEAAVALNSPNRATYASDAEPESYAARPVTLSATIDPDGSGPMEAMTFTQIEVIYFHDGFVEIVDGVCAFLIPVVPGATVITSTPATGVIYAIWDGSKWLVYAHLPVPTIYASDFIAISDGGLGFDSGPIREGSGTED